MNDNLLGYLLNALEPDEHRQVEEYLHTHPDAAAKVERLRQTLAPLSADAEPPVPPPSLAIGTFALIAEVQCRPPLPPAPPVPKPTNARFHHRLALGRRPDLVLAASLLILITGLITTWVVHAHEEAQRTTCGQNMYRWWQALERYSDSPTKSLSSSRSRSRAERLARYCWHLRAAAQRCSPHHTRHERGLSRARPRGRAHL